MNLLTVLPFLFKLLVRLSLAASLYLVPWMIYEIVDSFDLDAAILMFLFDRFDFDFNGNTSTFDIFSNFNSRCIYFFFIFSFTFAYRSFIFWSLLLGRVRISYFVFIRHFVVNDAFLFATLPLFLDVVNDFDLYKEIRDEESECRAFLTVQSNPKIIPQSNLELTVFESMPDSSTFLLPTSFAIFEQEDFVTFQANSSNVLLIQREERFGEAPYYRTFRYNFITRKIKPLGGFAIEFGTNGTKIIASSVQNTNIYHLVEVYENGSVFVYFVKFSNVSEFYRTSFRQAYYLKEIQWRPNCQYSIAVQEEYLFVLIKFNFDDDNRENLLLMQLAEVDFEWKLIQKRNLRCKYYIDMNSPIHVKNFFFFNVVVGRIAIDLNDAKIKFMENKTVLKFEFIPQEFFQIVTISNGRFVHLYRQRFCPDKLEYSSSKAVFQACENDLKTQSVNHLVLMGIPKFIAADVHFSMFTYEKTKLLYTLLLRSCLFLFLLLVWRFHKW